MEGLNTNDLLCCSFCSVSRFILNAWKILAFCGRILGQSCINVGKSDGCVTDECCLRHCYRGSSQNLSLVHRSRPPVMVPSQLSVRTSKYISKLTYRKKSNRYPLVNVRCMCRTLSVYYRMTGRNAHFDFSTTEGLWSAYMPSY